MKYIIAFTKKAVKDINYLKAAHLHEKAQRLLQIISENPYQNPPPYEKLVGNYQGLCSRRINLQHRLVYQVRETENTIAILSMWSHYEL